MANRPCVVVPGIEGSSLENLYAIPAAATWWSLTVGEGKFFNPDFDSLALDDDARVDRSQNVVNRANQLLAPAYSAFVQALRGRGVPAYLFPYDWRYSIERSAAALMSYLDQLSIKAALTIPGWDKVFDFGCHSMGGLVLRSLLKQWQSQRGWAAPVGQVVFIATPHLGSLDAAQALISGETSLLGDQKQARKLARTFPGVYELLPRFPSPAVRDGTALDVFQVKNWQCNVTDLVIKDLHGYDVQQVHLTAARQVLDGLPDPAAMVRPDDLLVIYGNKPGSTLRTVHVGPDPERWYNFDHDPVTRHGVVIARADLTDGDDVVPVESALLRGVAAVEIHADDVSYFHPIERGMATVDMHPFLPALDEVQTVVARFFQGQRGLDLLPADIDPSRFHP